MPPPATPAPSAAVHPCLRTHGKEVARLHLFDWIVLLLLVATTGVLGLVQPFHRFVAQGMMADLRYPMKGSTVPDWAVPVIAIVVPMVFIVGIYIKRRNVYDLHHAILEAVAGVTISSGSGFSLQRTTARVKDRRAAAPASVEAERLICRSLGIVQDGKDVTKDALDELGRRFQHELSPAVLSALRALFKLDDEEATAIEDALINRGGQAALDHVVVDATGGV